MRNNWHKIMENEIGIFITPVVRGMEVKKTVGTILRLKRFYDIVLLWIASN